MSQKRALTIKSVAHLLQKKGLIDEEQYNLVLAKGPAQEARLNRQNQIGSAKSYPQTCLKSSPAEVICSFNLESASDGKLLTENLVTELIAQAAGLEYLKIDPLKLNLDVVSKYISRAFAMKNLLIPVAEEGNVVTVAVVDPFNEQAILDLQQGRNFEVRKVLASRSDILRTLGEFFGFRASVRAAESEQTKGAELSNLEQYFQMKGQKEIESSDQHIIDAVEFLLRYAFDQRASDIHIEPKREQSLIRFRVDGILHNIHSVPHNLHPAMVSRIKLLARLDVAEKRRPQDGRIKTRHNNKSVELRVSSVPVAFGEKIVIRIFDPDILMQQLDDIGFYAREYQLYTSFINRPNGIVLVTGPTGSGKTTTLYSSLKTLSSPEVNIITIEDPIEMVMEEFNQIAVQPAIDVTFSTVLRTILRQDPDIIMVGEIRDHETADNAVQSALTGHLVLSTLHTNDAPSSLTRLMDLGVPAFLLGSTINGVVAQRLLRTICKNCKQEKALTPEQAAYLRLPPGDYPVWEGAGCTECRGTGYKGRTGVFEVMEFTDRVRDVLSDQMKLSDLYSVAREDGMVSLREVAIRKMLEGLSTFEEVVSVTG